MTRQGGLGEGVLGEFAEPGKVEAWKYPGDTEKEGSGPWHSREPDLFDYAKHEAALTGAEVFEPVWPDAAKNLEHFLENTGEPYGVDVDTMLNDLPEFQDNVQTHVADQVGKAIDLARASDAAGPVTYPFTTGWQGHYAHEGNWFYATGGFQYNAGGTVTVYPPGDGNPEWTYQYDYSVHMADRYNWDGDKGVTILGQPITDSQLQELHRSGLAREYDLVGESGKVSGP